MNLGYCLLMHKKMNILQHYGITLIKRIIIIVRLNIIIMNVMRFLMHSVSSEYMLVQPTVYF